MPGVVELHAKVLEEVGDTTWAFFLEWVSPGCKAIGPIGDSPTWQRAFREQDVFDACGMWLAMARTVSLWFPHRALITRLRLRVPWQLPQARPRSRLAETKAKKRGMANVSIGRRTTFVVRY